MTHGGSLPDPGTRSSVAGFITVTRGGEYLRVADPQWADPLSGEFARVRGGRWNAPGSFPIVYLNGDERVARANMLHRFAGLPYGPEDLEPSAAPILVSTIVPEEDFVDVINDAGCVATGLPATYPVDGGGAQLAHDVCRPVGRVAWDAGLPGIACRSAATGAPSAGEELVWFARGERLVPLGVRAFADWY